MNNFFKSSIVFLSLTLVSATYSSAQLKTVYNDAFLIGAAIDLPTSKGTVPKADKIIKNNFNVIVAENCMKAMYLQPKEGEFFFKDADQLVQYGIDNNQKIIGHTLIWHNQCPKWMFIGEDGKEVSKEVLKKRMKDHIYTVVKRYKGKIKGWDVVNEAISDKGGMRESQYYKILGEEFIDLAFQYAHEADPDAELYYNDYALVRPRKRDDAVALIKRLQSRNVPITGIGMQGHYRMDYPTLDEFEKSIEAFAALDINVMITELDLCVLPVPRGKKESAEVTLRFDYEEKFNPYTKGLPKDLEKKQAERYGELFEIMLKHKDVITRVNFWGVTDGDSWKNNHPIKGRTEYPLLFNRKYQPKAAYNVVLELGEGT